MTLRLMLIGLAGFAIAPASADAPANIAGHWTFNARVDESCTFGGTARLEKTDEGTYRCELTARQSCTALEDDYLVRQSCQVSVFGNQVSVRSTIEEFINGFSSPYYYPDNFALTIQSDDYMFGTLVSSGSTKPSEWRRSEGGIS